MESMISDSFRITVLRDALEIFKTEGVRNISEEKLLQKLNISQLTLKQIAPNKEALFRKAIELNILDNREKQEELLNKFSNSAQQLMELLKFSLDDIKSISPVYLTDFMSFPELRLLIDRELEEYTIPLYRKILNEGILQGQFRKDINIDIVTKIIVQNLYVLLNFNVFPPDKYETGEVLRSIYLYYFRGLSEPESAKMIDNYFA